MKNIIKFPLSKTYTLKFPSAKVTVEKDDGILNAAEAISYLEATKLEILLMARNTK